MHVEIIAVGGMQSLVDHNTTSHIILRMPNADQISVTVDGETAQAILDGAFDGLRKAEEPLRKAEEPVQKYAAEEPLQPELDIDPGADVVQEIFSAPPEPEMIEWALLPDETLSESMKQVLARAEIPTKIPAPDLVELIDAITRQENAQRVAQVQAAQAPQAQQQSTVGRVQQLKTAPRRTVPMDEKGYPIVAQQVQDRDPGEVATMGADEDGVPQA